MKKLIQPLIVEFILIFLFFLNSAEAKPQNDGLKPMIVSSDEVGKIYASSTDNVNQLPKSGKNCDLSEIQAENLTIEGDDEKDPNRVYLNLNYKFLPGSAIVNNGKKITTNVIYETMEIGFYRDWFAEGIGGFATQVHGSLPNSCSLSVGPTKVNVTNYNPPTFELTQGLTKRQCTSLDQPCGPPETTCEGGDPGALPSCSLPSCDWGGCRGGGCSGGRPPTIPTCRTTVKMCRMEQKVDVFSAETLVGYKFMLGVTGSPPKQSMVVQKSLTRNDISTSQGELTSALDRLGLAQVLNLKLSEFESGINSYSNLLLNGLQSGPQLFLVPTSDFIYMPIIRKDTDVSWWQPKYGHSGVAPFGFKIKRDMQLPTSLTCRVADCIRKSKLAGKLLVNSCSFN